MNFIEAVTKAREGKKIKRECTKREGLYLAFDHLEILGFYIDRQDSVTLRMTPYHMAYCLNADDYTTNDWIIAGDVDIIPGGPFMAESIVDRCPYYGKRIRLFKSNLEEGE
jgi:hypothetical protein